MAVTVPEETCPEQVWRGSDWSGGYKPCGRTFKTDEQRKAKMCGTHLGAKKRREANEKRRKEEDDQRASERRLMQEAGARLKELGVETHTDGGYTIPCRLVLDDPWGLIYLLEQESQRA